MSEIGTIDVNAVGEALMRYRQVMLLHAESAGLEWGKDSTRIVLISEQISALGDPMQAAGAKGLDMQGMYRGMEEFCALWTRGHVDPIAFVRDGLDYIAREAGQQGSFTVYNLRGLVGIYGPAVVEPIFEIGAALAGGVRHRHGRLETTRQNDETDAEEEIVAALGSDDPDFDEANIVRCAADADHASPMTSAEIEEGAFEDLCEIVEVRDKAARQAARGAPGAPIASG